MKVIRRGKMEDGTDIQIEDWSEDYSFYGYGTHLIAYPQNRFGERFRIEKVCEDNNWANINFDSLKGIEDLIRFVFTTKCAGRDVPFMEKMGG